jgi:rubrerythrin
MAEKCPERKLLLSQWTNCSSRVKKLLDEQRAATKISEQNSAGFEEQIRLARAAEIEARRTYFDHVNMHGCP